MAIANAPQQNDEANTGTTWLQEVKGMVRGSDNIQFRIHEAQTFIFVQTKRKRSTTVARQIQGLHLLQLRQHGEKK